VVFELTWDLAHHRGEERLHRGIQCLQSYLSLPLSWLRGEASNLSCLTLSLSPPPHPSLRPQVTSSAVGPSSTNKTVPEPEEPSDSFSSSLRLSPPLPTQQPPQPEPPPTTSGHFKINMEKYASSGITSRFTNGALKLETPDTRLVQEPDLERPKFVASRLVNSCFHTVAICCRQNQTFRNCTLQACHP